MKIRILVPLLITLVFLSFSPSGKAKSGDELPPGYVLSSNGTFTGEKAARPGLSYSPDGRHHAEFTVGRVTDENREILDFRLFSDGTLLYTRPRLEGADFQISNSGMVVVYDMDLHFNHSVTLHFLDPSGQRIASESLSHASLFGFSPGGDLFAAGTDKDLRVFDLAARATWRLERSSRFAFSEDGRWLATAFEGVLRIYKDFTKVGETATGLTYPRGVAVDPVSGVAVAIGRKELNAYDTRNMEPLFQAPAPGDGAFRDVMVRDGVILAGLHERSNGISRGILQVYDRTGQLRKQEQRSAREFRTFDGAKPLEKSAKNYDPIPWPFEPFDEVHKVWNHYEQHMGNGTGDWSYLHQGLDLEVPIDEPTYAVQPGWVKLVLTIGGDAYWRVAISPEQSSGYSDGWLYAHLVPGSIQVEVGDYVDLHDYLGDIIYWSADWGHIHFVNIRDQGEVWYYDDGEWGINFNPLLALTPNTDETPPVIEYFSAGSRFGFCLNETSVYQDPGSLTGEIDIIVKISDYHGTSEWEQPAYLTYYWIRKYPEGDLIQPKTLGQILNHAYAMYNSGYYEAYAPLLYKRDYLHPSPPWMNLQRDYYQILTNNNGDSIAEPAETALAFNTADHYDGTYTLYVEAWDEYGNMALDSQQVVFFNNNISGTGNTHAGPTLKVYPNPAGDWLTLEHQPRQAIERIRILDGRMAEVPLGFRSQPADAGGILTLHVAALPPGIYFIVLETSEGRSAQKFLKR